MTISLSTPVKYITSILLTALLTVGSIYAVSITALNQTAGPNDAISSTWVNAVNTAVQAAGGHSCVALPANATACNTLLNSYSIKNITYVWGGLTYQGSMGYFICGAASITVSKLGGGTTSATTAYGSSTMYSSDGDTYTSVKVCY